MSMRVLIVIGPSGVGKSSVVSGLRQAGLVEVIPTWTTRPQRHYENANNTDHVFCSEAEFRQREAEGYFMATTQPFGLEHCYGLPHLPPRTGSGRVPVLMLRASAMERVRRHFSDYVVYQVEAQDARVRDHLLQRALRDGKLGSRLDDFAHELTSGRRFANRIVDNAQSLAFTVQRVKAYLHEDFGALAGHWSCRQAQRSTPMEERSLSRGALALNMTQPLARISP